jgi:hypothetical protein
MPQTDDWSAFPAVTPPVAAPVAPAYPGVIPGHADPFKQQSQANENVRTGVTVEQQQLDQAKFDYQRQKDAEDRNNPPLTAEAASKLKAQLAGAENLNKRIAEVEARFHRDFNGSGPGAVVEYLPGQLRPANQEFNDAAGSLMGDLAAAYGLSAQQQNTPTELKIRFGPFIPSASDRDEVILAKIQRLKDIALAQAEQARQQLGDKASAALSASPASPPGSGGAPPSSDAPPPLGPAPTPFDNGAPGQTVATGQTKTVFEPAVAAGLNALVQHGRPYEEAAAFTQQHGFPPPSPAEYVKALEWQKAHPNSPYNAAYPTRTEAITAAEQRGGSTSGAAINAFADAATGFNLDSIVGATGGNAEQERQNLAAMSANSPVASALGTVAGGAATSLLGEAALARAGMAAALPRAMVADTAYGAVAGAGATDEGNRLAGAAKGALAAAGGSFIGNRVGGALSKVSRGVSDASVNALRKEGVDALTVGQTFANSGKIGAAVKSVEDRLSGLPIVGDVVKARQGEGIRQFNTKAFDKALEPIGETVAGQTGEQAIQTAQDKVSSAFTKALSGKGAQPDKVFGRDLAAAVSKASAIKRVGPELKDELASIFEPYANEAMLSGEALDDISRSLRGLKSRYAKSQEPIASSPRVAKAIDDIERSVFDLFDRQASGVIPEYRAARQAYRRVSILEDAVNKARNQKDRVFTPAQLGQADRSNATKYGSKRLAAAGDSPFFELQTAAQDVLPNKVPDSGTAGRVLVPLALIGAGEGSDKLTGAQGTGLTLGTILALAYSKGGQRLLTKPGRGVDSAAISRFLESEKTRRAIAVGSGATGAVLATQ